MCWCRYRRLCDAGRQADQLTCSSLQFFTTLNDLWSQSEEIWEGVFSLVAWCVARPAFKPCDGAHTL